MSEIEELKEIIRLLVESGQAGFNFDAEQTPYCNYCFADARQAEFGYGFDVHKEHCPIVRGREALK